MSTILITGGAGFIGSHLAETLLDAGERVLILDDLSSGSVRNIVHLRPNPRLEFEAASIMERGILLEMVDASDIVVHLAATVGVLNIIESPVTTIQNNVGGTEAVLNAAAKKRKKVIVASTSEVYGKSTHEVFREDGDLVFGPTSKSRWSYASSKVVDEFLTLAYWKEYRVPTIIVRLFNTIGPRQTGRYGMVVPRFLRQALAGQNLTVFGTGQQSRCFTYVADVVQWLLLLAAKDQAVGEVFNLGNPEEVTINELARRIIDLTSAQVGIDHVPYSEAYEEGFEDMERRVPEITKVRAVTGYSPQYNLDESLRLTRDWFVAEKILEESTTFQYSLPQLESTGRSGVRGVQPKRHHG